MVPERAKCQICQGEARLVKILNTEEKKTRKRKSKERVDLSSGCHDFGVSMLKVRQCF